MLWKGSVGKKLFLLCNINLLNYPIHNNGIQISFMKKSKIYFMRTSTNLAAIFQEMGKGEDGFENGMRIFVNLLGPLFH